MSLVRLAAVTALAALVTAQVSAQVPRRPREQQVATLPRLMVANPHVSSGADSAPAVLVGEGMRDRMARMVDGDYNVLTTEQMNDALKQYGYPANAILTPTLALQLAKSAQARVVVTATMARGATGPYTVTARLFGTNDETGSVVTVAQDERQDLRDFGRSVADRLEPAYKSLDEARECEALRETRPDRAANAARKALREYPANGLAEYCLAQIAVAQKNPSEAIQHFEAAAKHDPFSLAAWLYLAEQYQAQSDTANVLRIFQQVLRVAPTNQRLREQAFRYFLQAGKPDIAKAIADSGIKNDPFNPDFYDLKSNACAFLNDFRCAVQALQQAYRIDSTKADTLFFIKALAFSEQLLGDTTGQATASDTAEFVQLAQIATRKFPDNVALLQQVAKAYSMSGQVDSTIAVAQRLVRANPEDVTPALQAAQVLIQHQRAKEAVPLVRLAAERGDTIAKENAAAILYQAATPMLQEPAQDFPGAAELLREAVRMTTPASKVYAPANYLLGLATLLQVPQIDPEAEKQKSCELARQEEALLNEAEQAFTAGQSANPEVSTRNLEIIKKYRPRIASMLKAFCK